MHASIFYGKHELNENPTNSFQDGDDDSAIGLVDADGYPVSRVPAEKKKIEALPPIDHSTIEVRGGGNECCAWDLQRATGSRNCDGYSACVWVMGITMFIREIRSFAFSIFARNV